MAFKRHVKKMSLNYDVTFASSVSAALDILTSTAHFDIVFLDHNLGDGTAFDIFPHIPKELPFVLITGNDAVDLAVHAMKEGASDFLSKDIDGKFFDLIPLTVKSVIKSSKIENELETYKHNLENLVKERTAELDKEINERKFAQERWAFALDGAQTGVWDWKVGSSHCFFSTRWKEIIGFSKDVIFDDIKEFTSRIHPDDLSRVKRKMVAHLAGKTPFYESEHQIKCQDGSYKWIQTRGKSFSNEDTNERPRIIGTCEDITDKKTSQKLIWQQANYDVLTELPNRRMFYSRLEHELKKVQRREYSLGLFTLDLDKFKDINDTLGHDYGDLLLIEVAQRLQGCIRKSDTVARLGGDEFSIIIGNLKHKSRLEMIASKINHALSKPFVLRGESVYISVSIGITLAPFDSGNVDDLMKNADQAMYKAKSNGRNGFSFFTQSLNDEAAYRMALSNDLRTALIHKEYEAYYQPILALKSNKIVKAEALMRWHHHTRGFVSPAEFIPLAEEIGLINEMGDWILRESSLNAKKWSEQYCDDLQISVNVSPIQFRDDSDKLTRSLQTFLDDNKIRGKNLVVEITEGLLLNTEGSVTEKLQWLKNAGIQIAMDDFGTGYSSLSYIKKFNIDYLKIDKVFIDNIESGKEDRILCNAIIVMAHALNIKVVAEGIETQGQRDILCDMNCDFGQGFLFSRPVPAEEFEELLKASY